MSSSTSHTILNCRYCAVVLNGIWEFDNDCEFYSQWPKCRNYAVTELPISVLNGQSVLTLISDCVTDSKVVS